MEQPVEYIYFQNFPIKALSDEKGNYTLNGNNVITQYPRVFAYGGVTFEYTGTNTTMERVNSSFARRIKFDLTVEVMRFDGGRKSILIFFSFSNFSFRYSRGKRIIILIRI